MLAPDMFAFLSRSLTLFLLGMLCVVLGGCQGQKHWQLSGHTMGGIAYELTYRATKPVLEQEEVDDFLHQFNLIFSTYVPASEIARFNASAHGLVERDSLWEELLVASHRVHTWSKGAFDPTIAPLVNAWGFGPGKTPTTDTARIEELLLHVGLDKLQHTQKGLQKAHPALQLDMSAIAKGYAVDLLARKLQAAGITDYFIEIGGEIALSGRYNKARLWRIGIQDPLRPSVDQAAAILSLCEDQLPCGVATSGNYRNLRRVGKRNYAHAIDPRTGRPVTHTLLGVTIVASSAVYADALATACLVMGLEASLSLIDGLPEVEALFFSLADTNKAGEQQLRLQATPALRSHLSGLKYPLHERE